MADLQHNHRGLLTALAGGVAGLGLGAAVGVWWGRRIPGHIYRDGDDWYVDEPVRRELQHRIHGAGQGGDTFTQFGRGSIHLLPTQETMPAQSGMLYSVQATLRPGQTLEWVMLDLVVHRVGTFKLIRFTPRTVAGRMVQGPGVGPADADGDAPPGFGG